MCGVREIPVLHAVNLNHNYDSTLGPLQIFYTLLCACVCVCGVVCVTTSCIVISRNEYGEF